MVLYRSDEIRKYQVFAYCDWPGGLFGSIGMAGTRPGVTLCDSVCVCDCVCVCVCVAVCDCVCVCV